MSSVVKEWYPLIAYYAEKNDRTILISKGKVNRYKRDKWIIHEIELLVGNKKSYDQMLATDNYNKKDKELKDDKKV